MRYFVRSTTLVVVSVLVVASASRSADPKAKDPKQLSSNQALMRDKLTQVNRVLEGITLDNFAQVEESAKTLRMISRATSWHIADPTPQYNRLSQNFQEQATDLERHAKEKNVEAATLDLVRMNITCTQCHQAMRTEAGRK